MIRRNDVNLRNFRGNAGQNIPYLQPFLAPRTLRDKDGSNVGHTSHNSQGVAAAVIGHQIRDTYPDRYAVQYGTSSPECPPRSDRSVACAARRYAIPPSVFRRDPTLERDVSGTKRSGERSGLGPIVGARAPGGHPIAGGRERGASRAGGRVWGRGAGDRPRAHARAADAVAEQPARAGCNGTPAADRGERRVTGDAGALHRRAVASGGSRAGKAHVRAASRRTRRRSDDSGAARLLGVDRKTLRGILRRIEAVTS
jgi:hypothetical protein